MISPLYAIIIDGLFNKNGTFYVIPKAELRPIEEITRAGVFATLNGEGKISDEIITKLINMETLWLQIDSGMGTSKNDEKSIESVAQYIHAIPFQLKR